MKSGLRKRKELSSRCEKPTRSPSVSQFSPLFPRSSRFERTPQIRAALLVAIIVLIEMACVRNVRTLNDNFYVLNHKAGTKRPSLAPSPTPAVAPPSPSNSAVQPSSGPRPKSLLSNTGILEEEDPTISSLVRKAKADPADASVQFELGRAYHDYRLYDVALLHYQNALRLEPENPVYYEHAGRLCRDGLYLDSGLDWVKKALELNPGFVEAWNTLGTIYDRQGDSDKAQSAYLQALALNASLDYIHNNLCSSYLQSGRIEQAIRYGERATELNPTMLVAHNNLGLAYGMSGQLDRSLEEFKHSGDEATARNNLGLILLKRGEISEAMEQFKLAAHLRPYLKEAVLNYRRARNLNFQRAREARVRLRFFEHETKMETMPGVLGLVPIENAGVRLLDGTLDLLSSPTIHSGNPEVDVELETFGSRKLDERDSNNCMRTDHSNCAHGGWCLLGRWASPVFYKQGFAAAALELAHRPPGNQVVLRTHSPQTAELKVLLGIDSGSAKSKLYARSRLADSEHDLGINHK